MLLTTTNVPFDITALTSSGILTRCQARFTPGWKSAEWTCGMTLASAYVLCYLSAAWSQLQTKERKSEWK